MLIAKNVDGKLVIADVTSLFPNVSFPASGPDADFCLANGVYNVRADKAHTPSIEHLVPADPYLEDGMVYTVRVVAYTQVEQAQREATKVQMFMASVVSRVQERLDNFARTRNYDGIVSACTYATSSIVKFASEGQYAVTARDITWAALYKLEEDVNNGIVPMPASYVEIEAFLPTLAWPT